VTRNYHEFSGETITNGNLKGYILSIMVEKIKFRIDEVGAKVENEAEKIFLSKCFAGPNKKPKKFIFDRPFWIIMRQSNCHPYFIAFNNYTEFMKKNIIIYTNKSIK
jgi:hypothetical protein